MHFFGRGDRPRSYDYNLIVIGGGAAGLVSSYVASAAGARVALIESAEMGGDCLNSGCVPSKALIHGAARLHEADGIMQGVWDDAARRAYFEKLMGEVQAAVQRVAPHDSVERYTGLGVDCLSGRAMLLSPWAVSVDGRTITARSVIIATGAEPLVPAIPGIDSVPYLTSETFWNLRRLPPRLIVIGGGAVGCELAQAMNRLGSQVVLLEQAERLLPSEDPASVDLLVAELQREGVQVETAVSIDSLIEQEGEVLCRLADGRSWRGSVLLACGRRARTRGFGLEELALQLNDNGTIRVDKGMQTSLPGVYACGDVAGPWQFTHVAGHQAWYASVNALFRGFKRFAVDYSAIPRTVFCTPEIARVGLSAVEARNQGVAFEATRFDLAELDRAIVDGRNRGSVWVLTPPGKDRILGAGAVGPGAAEIVALFTVAMRHRLCLSQLLSVVYAYPTYAEAVRQVAGEWRRAHLPLKLLKWLKLFHRWRRGAPMS